MGKGVTHVFSEIFVQLNFHCKNDRPLITPIIEAPLHAYLEAYCRQTPEVYFKAVGGTDGHVRIAFQMEPTLRLEIFIGPIKGSSSHEMNQRFGVRTLHWQRGYGVVSFAKRNLPGTIQYIHRQKEHHWLGTTRAALERHNDCEESDESDDEPEGLSQTDKPG